jgi:hypothetical protein
MTFKTLISNINDIHNTLQKKALQSVSVNLTIRNYLIGHYIVEYEQNGNDRAEYGVKVIQNLADNLKYIKGLSLTNLKMMRQFYLAYPQISQTVSDKSFIDAQRLLKYFSFSHFIELIKIEEEQDVLFEEEIKLSNDIKVKFKSVLKL